MRLLFVVTRADAIGGAQVHVRDLASALQEGGHEVLVVTGETGPFTAALDRAGIASRQAPGIQRAIHPAREGRAVAALREIVREVRPDLVSCHSAKAGVVGRVACALTGTPCLVTAHGWCFTDGVPQPQRAAYRWLERSTAPLAAKLICVSDYDRRLGVAAGIRADRLITIHNGMPDVGAELRAAAGTGEPPRVVMIARFDHQKDHRTLIAAIAGIEGVHLDLVGDGPGMPEVADVARAHNVDDRVHLLGHRDDVAVVLAGAHVFALISNWEGFPRSTLEAMRAGLPVVVSDVGGAAEAVEEGVTGFVVPRGDVQAVRDRLVLLVGDAARRAAMGAAGRRRYEEAFTFGRMFDRTVGVYDEVVARAGTRRAWWPAVRGR